MRLAALTMVVGFVAGTLAAGGGDEPRVVVAPTVSPQPGGVTPPGLYDQAALEVDAVIAAAEAELARQAVLEAEAAAAARLAAEEAARVRANPPPTSRVVLQSDATGWPVSLEPCGGDLPPCWVKNRESHGDYNAVSPGGAYRGAWQFAYGTWAGYGGYAYANEAPPDVQDARAREVWAGGAGCSHWNACGS